MERIQLYPPESLKEVMQRDAELKGVSMSQLTVDLLSQYYGLAVPSANKKPLSEVIDIVIDEVHQYISEHKHDETFDLLEASETFKNIHMVANGKPSTNRATVGKVFAAKVGKDDFKNIAVVRTESGAVKKSINGATMYVIKDAGEGES